ncbi:MAG: hypothetical protein CMK76_13460 [Pseudomonadales bacterium]|nr:hypothetical protein [Pseudomonadales bacterium]
MVMHTGQVFRRMLEPTHRFLNARYLVAYLVGYLVAACCGGAILRLLGRQMLVRAVWQRNETCAKPNQHAILIDTSSQATLMCQLFKQVRTP